MSNRHIRPNQSKIDRLGFAHFSQWRALIASALLSSGVIAPGMIAWANSPAPGTVIQNQATGSFVDPSDSSTQLIESNIVQVTVAEVAGITVASSGYTEPTDGAVNNGDVVYFDFVITNVGNDPTQFFIPDAPSAISGGTAGVLQIIAYDVDGTGAGAAEDLSGSNITAPNGGDATGNLLNGVTNTNDGSVPAEGSITVRVPVTVTGSAGTDVAVTLGNTAAPPNNQNQPYTIPPSDSENVYTVDNAGMTNGDTTGAPLNGEREASDSVTVAIAAAPVPLIGVAKAVESISGQDVTLDFVIENFGNVTLDNLALADDLDTTFSAGNYSVTSGPSIQAAPSQGSTVTPSVSFTGSSGNTNLLDAVNSELAPGETVTIRIVVTVTDTSVGGDGNGNYVNNATVSGDAPDNTTVTDQSTDSTDPDVDDMEENAGGNLNDDNGTGVNDGDDDPTNNTFPTVLSFPISNTGGGFCSDPFNLVYSGSNVGIYAVHVESGAAKLLTNGILATANGVSSDFDTHLTYYAAGNSIYAWDALNDQHFTITNNFTSFLSGSTSGYSLSSGGAAFYNGSLYQGMDTGNFDIYKIDFVPGSNGRTIQSVTSIGIAALVANGTITGFPNWGDFTIDNNGLLVANGNGGQFYWSYDLNTNTFTDLADTLGTNAQIAKDGQGRLWGLGAGDIFQLSISGSSISEVPGTRFPTGNHSSYDAGECAVGISTLGDRIWEDANANDVQDPGENGIANVTVDLYWDLDEDGVIDSGEPVLATQTTDANGDYDFSDLLFGHYVVKVSDANNVLTDSVLTSSADEFAAIIPTGINDLNDADFGYQPLASDPNVLLVKRITLLNGDFATTNGNDLAAYIDEAANAYDDNTITITADPVDSDDPPKDTDLWPDPANFLIGGIDGGDVRPDDEIEYTIYFLSTGDATAKNVLLCDRVPGFVDFLPNVFNVNPDADVNGNPSGDRGIVLGLGTGSPTEIIEQFALTNEADGDVGYYFPPGEDPKTTFPNLNCGGTNDNGAVVVDLGDLPNATSAGEPAGSYGFVRFRARVR